MKISDVYPEYVFQRLAKYKVVAVNFKRGQFIDLETQTVGAILTMLKQTDVIKFYQLEEEETPTA